MSLLATLQKARREAAKQQEEQSSGLQQIEDAFGSLLKPEEPQFSGGYFPLPKEDMEDMNISEALVEALVFKYLLAVGSDAGRVRCVGDCGDAPASGALARLLRRWRGGATGSTT